MNILKNILLSLTILLVGGGCGVIVGANVVNLDYSESEYIEYGKQQKQEGLEEGFKNGQQVGYENGYIAGEDAGYDIGFEAGQVFRDPEKTYIDILFSGEIYSVSISSNESIITGGENETCGVYLLNNKDYSIDLIKNTNKVLKDLCKLTNGNILLSEASEGLYLYDRASKTVNLIYDEIGSGMTMTALSNGDALFSSRTYGLYKYNSSDNSISQIYDKGYSWRKVLNLKNGKIMLSTSVAYGILIYDETTNEINSFISSKKVGMFHEISNGNVFISGNSVTSIYLYDIEKNETISVFSGGFSWENYFELLNKNVLISSSNQSNLGILLYDNITNTATKIYNEGFDWNTFVEDENGVTISSSVNVDQGKVYYDFETGTVTPIEEESEL